MSIRTMFLFAGLTTLGIACSSGGGTGGGTPATGGYGTRAGGAGGEGAGGTAASGGVAGVGSGGIGRDGGRVTAAGGALATGGAPADASVDAMGDAADSRLPSTGGLRVGSGGARTGGLPSSGGAGGGDAGTNVGATGGNATVDADGKDGATGSTPVRLEWTNPILPQRADPHVFLHSDRYYYLTATVPEYDRIELRRATSFGGLATAEGKVVWRKHASGEMGAHIWAPEIHFIDGAWYIYFTAGRTDDVWAIRMYVLKNTADNPLEGTWTELGRIKTNWDSFSLDATTFTNAGQRYYLWTQTVPNYPGTSILIARMASPTTLTGAQVVLSSPTLAWEKQGHDVNEAPAALVTPSKVFITYSASATDHNYCMGMLTADATADLIDANVWKKASQPVFQSSSQTGQYGPGHNAFTTTPDGKINILVYHARNYRDIVGEPLHNPDRATRGQYLPFDASGLPVFASPVADGLYRVDVRP